MGGGDIIITRGVCLKQNPEMVFRKEAEGAFLFDPRSGNLKYLNTNGVNIYELCDGGRTVGDIIACLRGFYPEIAPETIAGDTELFLQDLASMDFLTISEKNGT